MLPWKSQTEAPAQDYYINNIQAFEGISGDLETQVETEKEETYQPIFKQQQNTFKEFPSSAYTENNIQEISEEESQDSLKEDFLLKKQEKKNLFAPVLIIGSLAFLSFWGFNYVKNLYQEEKNTDTVDENSLENSSQDIVENQDQYIPNFTDTSDTSNINTNTSKTTTKLNNNYNNYSQSTQSQSELSNSLKLPNTKIKTQTQTNTKHHTHKHTTHIKHHRHKHTRAHTNTCH